MEIKNDLISCPYNPKHRMKKSRLITHKKICKDKEKLGLVQCPFNPAHDNISIKNLEKHKEICPDRVVIDKNLAQEMESYIKNVKELEENKRNKDEEKITKFNYIVDDVMWKEYASDFSDNDNN